MADANIVANLPKVNDLEKEKADLEQKNGGPETKMKDHDMKMDAYETKLEDLFENVSHLTVSNKAVEKEDQLLRISNHNPPTSQSSTVSHIDMFQVLCIARKQSDIVDEMIRLYEESRHQAKKARIEIMKKAGCVQRGAVASWAVDWDQFAQYYEKEMRRLMKEDHELEKELSRIGSENAVAEARNLSQQMELTTNATDNLSAITTKGVIVNCFNTFADNSGAQSSSNAPINAPINVSSNNTTDNYSTTPNTEDIVSAKEIGAALAMKKTVSSSSASATNHPNKPLYRQHCPRENMKLLCKRVYCQYVHHSQVIKFRDIIPTLPASATYNDLKAQLLREHSTAL
ncbi:hypothetical protein P280DRAFT_517143 [Massarina eburnea CBS 473.64]|uniref:Uncharacterized protein n=1 Tax=Massarina eburnea CBS 473.64 TaxID=1395130 RepID=A0A6A6S2Q6_9PLEO|nr:hypothetical protein P280DRAFT_517143 [Massarina eburnea CBS 473.64]